MFALHRIFFVSTLLGLYLAVVPLAGAHAAIWMSAPQFKRHARCSEPLARHVEVARDQVLQLRLYIVVDAGGATPFSGTHLGFESFSGPAHFLSGELNVADIASAVRTIRGGQEWELCMDNTSLAPNATDWLGPPKKNDKEAGWITFGSDPASVQLNPRMARCPAEDGNCSLLVGASTILIADFPAVAEGNFSLRLGGVTSEARPAGQTSIFGRTTTRVVSSNRNTFGICPAHGCPVAAENSGPDRELRALAMQFALADFGRTVGGNVIEMIGERAAKRGAVPSEAYLAIGDRPIDVQVLGFGDDGGRVRAAGWLRGMLQLAGVNPNGEDGLAWELARATGISTGEPDFDLLPSAHDLLTGSSFELGLGGEDYGTRGKWTLWGGGGDMTEFSSPGGDRFSIDGEVFAGHVGLDYRVSEAMLVGVILSRSWGEVDYTFSAPKGNDVVVELSLTGAHHYLHWSPLQGHGVWGAFGYGRGATTWFDEKRETETGIGLRMTALGARRELKPIVGLELAVKADAFFVRTESDEQEHPSAVPADASRMRLALESRRSFAFEGGSLITGTLELGALSDAGNAETAAGAELGASLAYQHAKGIDVQARGHVLSTHQEYEFEQWGASLTVSFDRGPKGEGLFFLLAPTWGAPSVGTEEIWASARATEALLTIDDNDLGMSLDTRVGYGLNLPNSQGLLTLFGAMDKHDGASAVLRLGTQLRRLGSGGFSGNLELIGAAPGAGPAYGITLNARGNF